MNHVCLHAVLLAFAVALPSQPDGAKPQIVVAPGGLQPAPAPQPAPTPAPIPTSVRITGAEFELLTLVNGTGPIAWDVTSPDSFTVPVKLIELKPKEAVIGIRAGNTVPDRHESPDTPSVAVWAVNTGTATVAAWGVRDGRAVKLATFRVDANVGPRPPPKPDPDPPGPDPKPTPAKSFRVIFAVESGATLTTAQSGIIYGAAVEEWLIKNCTGGKDGFRRRDKDNPTVTGKELNEIWMAAHPLVTTTPVAIVEKNTHIEIIPLEATPEKMIVVFQEYLDGKRGK